MIDKKTLIYNAVLEIIKERGFSPKIRISDIAEKANIGKGTVYEYFDNKDEILGGAIISFIDGLMQKTLYEDSEKELDFKSSLKEIIEKVLDTVRKNYNIQSLFLSQNIGSMLSMEMKKKIFTRLEEVKLSYGKVFKDIIKKGTDEGVIQENIDDFSVLAAKVIIVPAIMEYIRQSRSGNGYDTEEFVEKLYDVVLKILS